MAPLRLPLLLSRPGPSRFLRHSRFPVAFLRAPLPSFSPSRGAGTRLSSRRADGDRTKSENLQRLRSQTAIQFVSAQSLAVEDYRNISRSAPSTGLVGTVARTGAGRGRRENESSEGDLISARSARSLISSRTVIRVGERTLGWVKQINWNGPGIGGRPS